jgi:formylglycine-generating enzyme required for sulfatase activity/murein DD-endopeptidase MepM/ murein hydrolase activator NlpD
MIRFTVCKYAFLSFLVLFTFFILESNAQTATTSNNSNEDSTLPSKKSLKAPWIGKAKISQGNNAEKSKSHNASQETWENTYALDIALPVGSDVLAPADGIVRYVDTDPGGMGGIELAIDHTDSDGKSFTTVYLHLSEVLKTKGDVVKQGEVIAKSGKTSSNPIGPHLHFHIYGVGLSLDSHTAPIESLIMKQVDVDSDFKDYNANNGDLDDSKVAQKYFESDNLPKFSKGDYVSVLSDTGLTFRKEHQIATNNKIDLLPKDTIVTILDNPDNAIKVGDYYWWYVQFGDKKGWCAGASYLKNKMFLEATVKPEDFFPLTKGTYWIYSGVVKWQESAKDVEKTLTWKMEVVDTLIYDYLNVAIIKGHPSDLDWYGGENQDNYLSHRLIVYGSKDGLEKFFLFGVEQVGELATDKEKAIKRIIDNAGPDYNDDLFLELPLTIGKKFGDPEQITRSDNAYCWYVESKDQIQLNNIKGISSPSKMNRYRLVFQTLPDDTTIEYVQGIGITRYAYNHHGTTSETDLKLIEYGKGQVSIPKPSTTVLSGIASSADMVLIPAGEFQMGSNYYNNDCPIHTVYLDAFYIDKYEVTNAQYKKFVQATGHQEPEYTSEDIDGNRHRFKPWSDPNFNGDDQPVVCVSWEDAKAYANWAGKRLPTEAEWEKAARGGLSGKRYVWGNDWHPPKNSGNFADETAKKVVEQLDWIEYFDWIIGGYDDGYGYTAPVGSFKPNGYGLYDMAGNVWEWCADWYNESYYTYSPKQNPTGPLGSTKVIVNGITTGSTHVFRGGSWYDNAVYNLQVASRDGDVPTSIFYGIIGFRCAGLRIP